MPAEVIEVAPFGRGMRLDAYLARYHPERSRAEWQRMIETGALTLAGRALKPSTRLLGGERLRLVKPAATLTLEPEPAIPLDVVYEDESIVVINKPPGLVVHPAPGHERGTLVNALLARYPDLADPTGLRRPGIVHRLDKDSGLMVVGKTAAAVSDLQRQMKRRETVKRYYLLVLGRIEEDRGEIDAPIGRDPFNRQKMAVRADGKEARTTFVVRERFRDYTLVEAELESGRTHQLRVHFAYIGHPVAGDPVYGSGRRPHGLTRQFVHAHYLALCSPATRTRHEFRVGLPPDLATPLRILRRSEGRPEELAL